MEPKLSEAAVIGGTITLLPEIHEQVALGRHRISANCLNSSSPLHLASSRGQKDRVIQLLQTNPELAEALDSRKRSPLHLAAAKESLDIVRELVKVSPEMCEALDSRQRSPLHLAAAKGSLDIVRELVKVSPEMCEALDSRQRSPLHLAAAKGFVDIVRALVEVSPEMCRSRDRDDLNPLHLEAMKGQVVVLEELVQACPDAAVARVDRGATILHLCVIHDQLNALDRLLKLLKIRYLQIVNAKDADGNTILHLAVMHKRFQIVEHVLKDTKIAVNAKNENEHTAMDILHLAKKLEDKRHKPDKLNLKMEKVLKKNKGKRAKGLVAEKWLSEKRDTLMVVASLIATMAFQAAVNPPGGFWQDNNDHKAGKAVMASEDSNTYGVFFSFNTVGFVTSLSTILLLICGLPFRHRFLMWVLVVIMLVAISATTLTYVFASKMTFDDGFTTVSIGVFVWFTLLGLLLLVYIGRLIVSLIKKLFSVSTRIFRYIFGRIDQNHQSLV